MTFTITLPEEIVQEIILAGRFLDRKGLCPATSGNISIRLNDSHAAITASGIHKGELEKKDILIVNKEGHPINSRLKPSAETLLHTFLYAHNANIGAILHAHSLHGTVLSKIVDGSHITTKGYEIHKIFTGINTHESELHIPIFENNQNIGTLAESIDHYLKIHPLVFGYLLRGHGLYTWGKNMHEAKTRLEAFEFLFASELKMRKFFE